MEQKTKKKNYYFIKFVLLIAVFVFIVYYAYSFPKTMELLDEAAEKAIRMIGIEKDINIFSAFSEFSKETAETAIYWAEVIKENISGMKADGKKLPVAVITCAAKFPSEGKYITSGFGKRKDPFSGKDNVHTGIDIAAPSGSSVISAWPGLVLESGFDEIYGNYIIVEHSEDFFTKYCHLSSVTKIKNDFINAGEKIGEVGNTGRSTGNHLHFEISIGGINIDPMECFEI